MNKTKSEKGITLVALVITIIVLLILAVVAIGAVRDSGIIGHAQNSADRYNAGKLEEESMIGQYENAISQYETDINFGTNGSGNENVDTERVPFTNYIEDGYYYYVYRENDTKVQVVTISRESASFTRYRIESEQIVSQDTYNCEIIDKLEALNSFGLAPENTQQALGLAYNDINDDVINYVVTDIDFHGANIFKSNYTEMIFEDHWFTLDESYMFPNISN